MLELRTGVPGSGKTLSMVEALARLFKRWEKHPEEARPVFVHNIKNLAFPVSALPLKQWQRTSKDPIRWVPDWEAMPDGSLVLIDECQGSYGQNADGQVELLFPPRASGSEAPPHVAWLNTHRHKGFDIWLTTQHPKLIDNAVRALVGKHMHYRRLFGGSRAAVYEWDACSDNLSGLKTAVLTYWPYPRRVFQFYKSAEVHTKQNFKLPSWVLIPFLGLGLMAFFVPKAYSSLFGSSGLTHGGSASVAASSVSAAPTLAASAVQPAQGGAYATPSAGLASFPPIDSASSVQASSDRSPASLKLAHGVYGDTPTEAHHFTAEELQRQAVSVAVLERHEAAGRFVAVAVTEETRPQFVENSPRWIRDGYWR